VVEGSAALEARWSLDMGRDVLGVGPVPGESLQSSLGRRP